MNHAVPTNPCNETDGGGRKGVFAKDMGYFSTYWSAKFFGLAP